MLWIMDVTFVMFNLWHGKFSCVPVLHFVLLDGIVYFFVLLF